MKIGVIGLQGAVSEHCQAFEEALDSLGIRGAVLEVRTIEALTNADAIAIPGGESTTISNHMKRLGLTEKVRSMAERGTPIMGTCAGCVLVADELVDDEDTRKVQLLELMDMSVKRNAFGRQKESFERQIEIEGFDSPFEAVFIRAPLIVDVGGTAKVLSTIDEGIIMARQDNVLAVVFHPELTDDLRIHEMLIEMI